jgi:hypothetical protein
MLQPSRLLDGFPGEPAHGLEEEVGPRVERSGERTKRAEIDVPD